MRDENILSNFTLMLIFVIVTFVTGIVAGIVYYDVNLVDSILHTVNFQIPIQVNATNQQYANVTDFQSVLGIVVYPILGLRSALIPLTYFMIFGFIIALAIVAYVSSKNPVFLVLHVLFTLLITYFSILLSNAYIKLLENQFINQLMTNFTIYNKIMIYLPEVLFFTSLVFGIISFVNPIKPQSNNFGNQTGLNYGGDY